MEEVCVAVVGEGIEELRGAEDASVEGFGVGDVEGV